MAGHPCCAPGSNLTALSCRSTVDYDSGAALAQAMQQMNSREWSPDEEPQPNQTVEVERLRTVDLDTGKKLQAALKSMPGAPMQTGPGARYAGPGARYGKKSAPGPGPLQRQIDRAAAERANRETEQGNSPGLSYLKWQTDPEAQRPVQATMATSSSAQPVMQPMQITSKAAEQKVLRAPLQQASCDATAEKALTQESAKNAVGDPKPDLHSSAPRAHHQIHPVSVCRMHAAYLRQRATCCHTCRDWDPVLAACPSPILMEVLLCRRLVGTRDWAGCSTVRAACAAAVPYGRESAGASATLSANHAAVPSRAHSAAMAATAGHAAADDDAPAARTERSLAHTTARAARPKRLLPDCSHSPRTGTSSASAGSRYSRPHRGASAAIRLSRPPPIAAVCESS